MKNEDFDRLKKLCDENGFEMSYDHKDCETFNISTKKDIWEGVEFAEDLTVSGIVKITPEMGFIKDSEGTYIFKKLYKPSTEQAYVEQLKAKAFELYGEIKDGDRFDCSVLGLGNSLIIMKQGDCNFEYFKETEDFRKGGFILYRNGKWAKKVPKRIEVEFHRIECSDSGMTLRFNGKGNSFISLTENYKGGDLGRFLAKKLEKYLNGEIEKP